MIAANIQKTLLLTFSILISIFVVVSFSWSLISDPDGEHVRLLKNKSEIQPSITLPFSKKFLHEGNPKLHIKLEPIETINVEEPYLFIPFYEGFIKIFNYDNLIYDSEINGNWKNLAFLNSVFIALPKSKKIEININFLKSKNAFLSMSDVFFGPADELRVKHRNLTSYYSELRVSIFGAQIFIVAIICLLTLKRSFDRNTLTPIVILIFISGLNLSSQAGAFPFVKNWYPYITLFAPVCCLGLRGFQLDIRDTQYDFLEKYIVVFTLCLAFASIGLFFGIKYVQYFNLYFTIPFVSFFLSFLVISSFTSYHFKSSWSELGFITIVLVVIISVLHDVSFRLGYTLNGVVISNISLSILFFFVTSFYLLRVFQERIDLSEHTKILEKYQTELRLELSSYYSERESLLSEQSALEEVSRLNAELHDGIMTNVSMISALSENQDDEDLNSINILSQSIMSEIRVLIMLKENEHATLPTALSILRTHIVEPAEQLGVDVSWSTIEISDLQNLDYYLVLEIFRIFQEGLHNALFRASSKKLVFRCFLESDGNLIMTLINARGRSFDPNSPRGYGLTNMASRANKIGAALTIDGSNGGATLMLNLPLNQEVP